MEKRLVSFFLASTLALISLQLLQRVVFGPPQPPPVAEKVADVEVELPAEAAPPAAARPKPAAEEASGPQGTQDDRQESVLELEQSAARPDRLLTVGSLDPASGYQMLVYFSNLGGSIDRIELNSPQYRELEDRSGYLGYLGLVDDADGGCRVRVVGPGSPASRATSSDGLVGLQGDSGPSEDDGEAVSTPGDRIIAVNGSPIANRIEYHQQLARTRPGQKLELTVMRGNEAGEETQHTFEATLVQAPLAVASTEPVIPTEVGDRHPSSYLLTLDRIQDVKTKFNQTELDGLPSLRNTNWSVRRIPDGVEFRQQLSAADLQSLNVDGELQIVKRFRLSKSTLNGKDGDEASSGFVIDFDIECHNAGEQPLTIGYQLDGPTGMTTEGWWFLYKVHPTRFVSAGARDVIWRAQGGNHKLFTCGEITKHAKKALESGESLALPIFAEAEPERMRYIGCDTQYFVAALQPSGTAPTQDDLLKSASAIAVGPLDKHFKRTDVTFRVRSPAEEIAPGETMRHSFSIFTGPKERDILARYGLEDTIVFGWFGAVSRPMLGLLHILYNLTGQFSYGLAIVLLTVIVRASMFPLGKKMALNAQKMQELAPEMKKIADKYKNDLEKRGQAQRELFAQHKYNPFSGCLVMFIQMPIFLGLYRGLSSDIALRGAPLIPGMSWCSNLAGPDKFFYWDGLVPAFLSSPFGMLGLGPYLNILPLITVGLFLIQHKLFTPPPQDEQQKMQHSIMKFMMLFMGFLFHKVAAGLCLYLITSTLWGLAERTMLPKAKAAGAGDEALAAPPVRATRNGSATNGAAEKRQRRKKQKRR